MSFLDKLMFWKKEDDFGTQDFSSSNPFGQSAAQQPGFDSPSPFGGDPFSAQSQQSQGFGDSQNGGFASPFDTPDSNPFASPNMASPDAFSQQNQPFGQSSFGTQNQGMSQSFSQNSQNTQPLSSGQSHEYGGEMHKKDIELVLSRLDLIRSEIDNVNHRLNLIEQNMKKPRW